MHVTKIHSRHRAAIGAIDAACDAMVRDMVIDPADARPRSASDLERLTTGRGLVADVDGTTAAFLAWRDEPPSVAYVVQLAVHPRLHRRGIGTRLLASLYDQARADRLTHVVLHCLSSAGWAVSFYESHGFVALQGGAPRPVRTWSDHRKALTRPLVRPGERVLWASVSARPGADGLIPRPPG